jgi:glycolate oxidase iron-sulfur subunit
MAPSTAPLRPADPDRLRECIHCGLCLNACPTYLELGTEMDSPRGRIYLIKGLADGTLALDDEVVRHLDLCLGCRACETACPSGVRYGSIIEDARAYVEQRARRPWSDRLRRAGIKAVFPYPRRMRVLTGLAEVARGLGLWSLVTRLVEAAALLPPFRSAAPLAGSYPARGRERARVGLLRLRRRRALRRRQRRRGARLTAHGVTVLVPPQQGAAAPAPARRRARVGARTGTPACGCFRPTSTPCW